MPTTINTPTQTPALKIAPIAAQLLSSKERNTIEIIDRLFFIVEFLKFENIIIFRKLLETFVIRKSIIKPIF